MATAKKTAAATKAVTTPRRTIPASSLTSIKDSGDIVEGTDGEKISLPETRQANETDSEKVTVVVPKAFTLTLDDGGLFRVEAGTQEMPADIAAHWFSRAQGVKVYVPD